MVLVVSSAGLSNLVCKKERFRLSFLLKNFLVPLVSFYTKRLRAPPVMQSMENRKCFLLDVGTTDEPDFKVWVIHLPLKAIVISFCFVWICASGFSSKASWMRALANWIFFFASISAVRSFNCLSGFACADTPASFSHSAVGRMKMFVWSTRRIEGSNEIQIGQFVTVQTAFFTQSPFFAFLDHTCFKWLTKMVVGGGVNPP